MSDFDEKVKAALNVVREIRRLNMDGINIKKVTMEIENDTFEINKKEYSNEYSVRINGEIINLE